MERIYLVRHGESLSNIDKSKHLTIADHAMPLSEKGLSQARAAGQFLAHRVAPEQTSKDAFSRIRLWTSPYKRTRQTAEAIRDEFLAAGQGYLRIHEHINLVEQQFGLFDGLSDAETVQKYPAEFWHYKRCEDFGGRFWARMPLGESRFDVAVRVHQAFGTFRRDFERHGVDTLIVVAHGTTIRAFVMQWLHLPYEWFEKEGNPANCSVRLIVRDSDRGYIHPGG